MDHGCLHFSPRISARVEQLSNIITQKLKIMVEVPAVDVLLLRSKHKTIDTLLPYAIRLEQGGEQEMVDVILSAAGASESILKWRHIETYVAAIFDEHSPPSLDRVITIASPFVSGYKWFNTQTATARWAAAASTVSYSRDSEVAPSVVDILLRVSDKGSLRQIPISIWAWLKNRPPLPPVCQGRSNGSQLIIVRHVRGLRDIEILKSYLFLIWSEWDSLDFNGLVEMQTLIREDFDGVEMQCHRNDLIEHLDHVQGQLNRGLEHFRQHRTSIGGGDIQLRKEQYKILKGALLEVEEKNKGTETLTRMPPRLTLLDQRTNCGCFQNPT
jgi:hypothetical protein